MKLVKAYVSSFGGLKDFEYNFSDGINTINQENGWGKTTFATFLKCMFYGLNKYGVGIEKDERKKYKPWNSIEKFGGYLVFERAGNLFRVERFFGNKASEDTFNLTDEKTGKAYNFNGNLGEKMFKIDEDGFLSTIYYSQKDFEITSSSSIVAKFNEVYGVQDTDLFDKAVEKIETKIRKYKTTGERGIIYDLKNNIKLIDENLNKIATIQDGIKSIKLQYEENQKELLDIEDKLKSLREKQVEAGKEEAIILKKDRLNVLCKDRDSLIENKTSAEKILNNNDISLDDINNYKSVVKEFEQENIKRDALVEMSNSSNKRGMSFSFIPLIASIVAIILAFVLKNITPLFYTFIGLAFVLFILFIFFAFNRNKVKPNNYNKKVEDLEKLCNQCKLRLDNFVCKFVFDISLSYEKIGDILEKAIVTKDNCTKQLSEIEREIKELKQDSSLENNLEKIDGEKLNKDVALLESWQREKHKEGTILKNKIDYYQGEIDSKVDLESQKVELLDKKLDAEKQSELLSLTLEYLKRADSNLKTKMRLPLECSLNKYLGLISNKALNAKIDIDFGITIEEKGVNRESVYFSKGYKNIFEICKRLALIDVLFTEEKPFIILDDPFFNLDNENVNHSLELLKNLSKDSQILYFVCHNSRAI